MARTVAGIWWPPTMEGTPALVVSAAFFGLGGVAGCFLALQSASDGVAAMHDYLDRFLAAAQAGAFDLPGISETLWRSFRWPLAAVLLGFTAMGLLGIPLLASMRGFFLSFSIASFAYAYGRKGLLMVFSFGNSRAFSTSRFFASCCTGICRLLCVSVGRRAGKAGESISQRLFSALWVLYCVDWA